MQWFIRLNMKEGTSDPFIAHFYSELLELRDQALNTKDKESCQNLRDAFDKFYYPVLDALEAARMHAKDIIELIRNHNEKLVSGEILSTQPNAMVLNDDIDKRLRNLIVAFVNSGGVASKEIQKLARSFGVEIGFMFQSDKEYAKGLSILRNGGNYLLADYCSAARTTWSDSFRSLRDSIEHHGWRLDLLKYDFSKDSGPRVIEPCIDGIILTLYIQKTFNRIASFIEDIMVYAFKINFLPFIALVEIPANERDPGFPRRFSLDLKRPDVSEWELYYTETQFL